MDDAGDDRDEVWDAVDEVVLAASGFLNAAKTDVLRDSARRAALLRGIASGLEQEREQIVSSAAAETALTPEELAPEFVRMVGTLRMFAELIDEGSWVRAAIDTRTTGTVTSIGPNHDVRRMLVPLSGVGPALGVVAVFGSSNFPLAYGVCGGDTASALAAGCAVVVKEHPAHPKTGRLLVEIARRAIAACGVDQSLLGYVHNEDPKDFRAAKALVQHPQVVAVGFTGSIPGGRAIEKLAQERQVPIPVFAEMGSSNMVIITRAAAAARGREIAQEIAASMLVRVGQQCTNTGLVLIDRGGASGCERTTDAVVEELKTRLLAGPPRRMLTEGVRITYEDRIADIAAGQPWECRVWRAHDARSGLGVPTLVHANFTEMCEPRYMDEIFGPACIVLHGDLDDPRKLDELIFGMNDDRQWGQLVGCVYMDGEEDAQGRLAMDTLQRVCGRVVVNGVPTGVRVAHGMVHGGPFPATNRPESTAVGPYAIERWCRPVCWQNCPDALLPEELKDANPRGVWRMVNGAWTKAPAVRA